jgi:hypothetical protein
MLRDRTRALLSDPEAPLRPLFDETRVRALATGEYEGSTFGTARQGMELAPTLNDWPTRYPVRLLVDWSRSSTNRYRRRRRVFRRGKW